MAGRSIKLMLTAGTALAAVSLVSIAAQAGGFAVREQSAVFQGTSFAGAAAGGAASSMFWNPATMTLLPGFTSETDIALILPSAKDTSTSNLLSGTPLSGLVQDSGDNTGGAALVPSGYTTWQVLPTVWLGLSTNSPFGLSTNFQNNFPGRNYALSSSLKTYNATPSVAWKINDWLSVGAGVQIQYAQADLNRGLFIPPLLGGPSLAFSNLHGNGWGYGFTAGATITLSPATRVGLGWRSYIDQDIKGSLAAPPVFGLAGTTTNGPVSTTLKLPDIVSAGIRHQANAQWTFLGTVEWTNWSRIGTSTVSQLTGLPAAIGGTSVTLPFQFKDGWFFSGGAEYAWSPSTTLRAGAGYEISPISDSVRIPLLPDNDRIWGSVGLSYIMGPGITLDLAYSHLWVKGTHIDISAASGNPWFNANLGNYVGDVSSHVDILSLGFRWQLSPPEKPALITKG